MKLLVKNLYSFGQFKMPNFFIKDMLLFEKISVLKIISKRGHYKDRFMIVENIKSLNLNNQYELIEILIHDKVENISKEIIKKFEYTYLPKNIESIVESKIQYWKEKKLIYENNQELNSELLKGSKNYKRKFGKGESYQNLKQMSRKSMNTGKWF